MMHCVIRGHETIGAGQSTVNESAAGERLRHKIVRAAFDNLSKEIFVGRLDKAMLGADDRLRLTVADHKRAGGVENDDRARRLENGHVTIEALADVSGDGVEIEGAVLIVGDGE